MARYGFHGGKDEIKFLILFITSRLSEPVTLAELGEVALLDEGVDYFLFCQCVDEMVQSGHLEKNIVQRGEAYVLAPKGTEIVPVLENELAPSLRRATCETIDRLLSGLRRDANIQAEIFMRGGVSNVRMSLSDGHDPLLTMELMAGSEEQAEQMRRHFRKNAETIYTQIMALMLPPL